MRIPSSLLLNGHTSGEIPPSVEFFRDEFQVPTGYVLDFMPHLPEAISKFCKNVSTSVLERFLSLNTDHPVSG
jgi:hypothetical protein